MNDFLKYYNLQCDVAPHGFIAGAYPYRMKLIGLGGEEWYLTLYHKTDIRTRKGHLSEVHYLPLF